MSNRYYQSGQCPLQNAIEHVGLAAVIAENRITRLMVSSVEFMPDVEPHEGVLPTFENRTASYVAPRQAEYGDLVVVFKVLEKYQE